MFKRCSGWRARRHPASHPDHEPGSCRRCWRPCLASIEPPTRVCAGCLAAASRSPMPSVRLAVAEHPDTGADVLAVLATDVDFAVSDAARPKRET
jgi:hypothetical protein